MRALQARVGGHGVSTYYVRGVSGKRLAVGQEFEIKSMHCRNCPWRTVKLIRIENLSIHCVELIE